ncbi:Fe-S cluster assembly ATPase SufC [Pseudoflavonifractor sp. MSJ-37]|uniref:Fe-S cluster assembly ATPase SufC n=1 Tax=Pseudoflavonifractor sp. MSJ-37 TaxID=2841531 RepID=UPI001C1242DD|nr:Fe-S cluster assembly ATPase SufC [Pseudoflavonifractor sp. MSJ-37]MBU5434909.1 Fe-S cluster assembly ATPase SufC [Pseudoflavonifractor sp. MSJ-37]
MSASLLKTEQLNVSVEGKHILYDVDMTIREGETHVLMGPNGAGKSTLGYTLMGGPRYHVDSGRILLEGRDITESPADQRARDGLFLSFQEPLEVPGLSLQDFLRSALEQRTGKRLRFTDFYKKLKAAMEVLHLDPSYSVRDLNVGFSGGEKKKIEILQLLLFQPKLAILDETDSGLDVDAVRLVSDGVRAYQKDHKGALLIITHSTRILESLHVDQTHVMVEGHMVADGDGSMVDEINENGYESYVERAIREGAVRS